MNSLRCHQQGCQKDLVYETPQREVVHSYAVCMSCRQEVLCVQHLQERVQHMQGQCRVCKNTRWSLQLLPHTRFSPQLQAFIIQNSGQIQVVDESPSQQPSTSDDRKTPMKSSHRIARAYARHQSSARKPKSSNSQSQPLATHYTPTQTQPDSHASSSDHQLVSHQGAHQDFVADSQQRTPIPQQRAPIPQQRTPIPQQRTPIPQQRTPSSSQSHKSARRTPTPVSSLQVAARHSHARHHSQLDPYPPQAGFDAYASHQSTHQFDMDANVKASTAKLDSSAELSLDLEPTNKGYPKTWRLITKKDLPRGAQGLGHGVAIARENDRSVLMMDDDRIIRNLDIEGEIISVTQSPRKRRLIVERKIEGVQELVWLNSKEIQGFITNPLDDQLQVFGAHFTHDNRFVYFAARPDGRFDMREGSFTKGRGIQSRLLGGSVKGVPLAPICSHRSQRVFFFKKVSESGYVPVCRRLTDGDDRIMGELCEKPVVLHASRNADTIAWIDQQGYIWVCSETQEAIRLGQTQSRLLAVSHDGYEVAWIDRNTLYCYQLEQQSIKQWSVEEQVLAIGWRSEIF